MNLKFNWQERKTKDIIIISDQEILKLDVSIVIELDTLDLNVEILSEKKEIMEIIITEIIINKEIINQKEIIIEIILGIIMHKKIGIIKPTLQEEKKILIETLIQIEILTKDKHLQTL